jgi:hypothetical protein
MDTFFIGTVLDPMIAFLGILLPLGLAYVILFFQSRNLDYCRTKVPAKTRDDPQQVKAELSGAEKKQASRLMMYWLF